MATGDGSCAGESLPLLWPASPIVESVIGKIQSLGSWASAPDGLQAKLQELEGSLLQIRGALGAAERQGTEDRTMADWLDKLRDAVYDADDTLDEMEYQAMEPDSRRGGRAMLSSRHRPLASALRLGKRLFTSGDEIMASRARSLKDLSTVTSKVRALVPLLKKIQGAPSNPPLAVLDFVATDAPAVPLEDQRVFGRVKEVNDVVQMLIEPLPSRCDQPAYNIPVISIVGIGGLGKTTLAQSVYNDIRVNSHFDLTAWALVSHTPDKMELTKEILCSANPTYRGSVKKEDVTIQTLLLQLNRLVESKRFLLVLDDVWGDSFTNKVCQEILYPLRSVETGSRIIVTTRTVEVADMLGTSPIYYLNALSIEDCWSLIKDSAFGGRDTHNSIDELEQIGRKIASKLNGLPLAAKVLGGLLGATKSTKDWINISEMEFCGDITLSSLQLSYNYLPGQIKQCFALCSLFPKNWKFDRTYLIHLWMAQGFTQPSSAADRRMEDLGTDYFNVLLSRSFFQTLRQGSNTHYVMHDLVHDLAVSASTYECRRIELGMTHNIPSTVRHLSVTTDSLQGLNRLHMLPKKLRTLLVIRTRSFSLNCLDDLLEKLKILRVLDLRDSDITELPQAIGHLSHLRYLSLSRTIRALPESISKLRHLQTLCCPYECHLDKLPTGINLLVMLRHLVMDTRYIAQVKGIRRLVNLQGSVKFHVKNVEGHILEELGDIKDLRGELIIKGLDNVLSKDEAAKAKVKDKKNLRALRLDWSSANRILSPVADYEVLENLQPPENLKHLHIIRYLGAIAPSWLQLGSLRELESLYLINCRSLGTLPPLGLLPSLKELHMKELCMVNRIGYELYGTDDMAFASLKVLVLEDFPSLLEWSGEVRGDSFPCLQRLKIADCPKLIQVPSLPPSVSELMMERTWLISYMRFAPFSSRSEMFTLDISTTSVLCKGLFHQRHLDSVVVLNIKACSEGLVAAEGLDSFTSIQRLQLWHSDLSDQNLGSILQVLPSLHSLEMMDLPNIISLPLSANISLCTEVTELQISNCPLLSSLVSLVTFISLKRLVIEKCPKLTAESFPINFWRLTSLKVLSISYCTEFQSLPTGGLPTSLEALHLVGCHPKLTEQSSNGNGNCWEKVSALPKKLIQ